MTTPAFSPSPSVEDVRASYGARADEYVELLGSVDLLAARDRDTITAWATGLDGPVIDAGSGPGHWTNHLHELGVAAEGVDMVPEFVDSARSRFPDVPFHAGQLSSLPVDSGSLAGLLSWYSVIHTVPDQVPGILAEFARCLQPDGSLLLGFFEGEVLEPFDHAVVTAYYWPVSEMRRALEAAGFEVVQVQTRVDPGSRPLADVVARLR